MGLKGAELGSPLIEALRWNIDPIRAANADRLWFGHFGNITVRSVIHAFSDEDLKTNLDPR